MALACPNDQIPAFSAVWTGAVLSVCCIIMSAPWSINACAASASLPGSYQLNTQTIFVLILGFTFWAAKVIAFIPLITSGIGNDAM